MAAAAILDSSHASHYATSQILGQGSQSRGDNASASLQHSGGQHHSDGYRPGQGLPPGESVDDDVNAQFDDDNDSLNSEDEVSQSLRRHDEERANREYEQQGGHARDRGEDGEEDDLDDSGSFSDSLSSSPSIPDEDIDFALVYALHTFLATVDGQASVVKGDKLLLLDDTNSYWWLVRVLKTQAVGYIPAENIETPWERLARLNKHRNVDLTSATQEDHITGPNSTLAQTRFDGRIPPSQQPHPHRSQHPLSKGVLASPSHKDHPRNISPVDDARPASRKGKSVLFTAPTYYEHSANGDEDEDAYGDDEDGEDQQHPQQMDVRGGMHGEQVFEDEDHDESEFSDDGLGEDDEEQELHSHQVHLQQQQQHSLQQRQEQTLDDAAQTQAQRTAEQVPVEAAPGVQLASRPLSPRQEASLREQQQQSLALTESAPDQYQTNSLQRQHEQQQILQQQHQQRMAGSTAPLSALRPEPSTPQRTLKNSYDGDAPTKKLSASPPIVRDHTFDINNPFADQPGGVPVPRSPSPLRVRGVEVVDPSDPRYRQLIPDKVRGASTDGVGSSASLDREREVSVASVASVESGSSAANSMLTASQGSETLKRDNSGSKKLKRGGDAPEGGEEKKKKGILSGLFRKKDKKKPQPKEEVESAPTQRDSLEGPGQRRQSQTAENMFSTGAALRQQQVEAKQALFNQYGVSRAPGDVSNTMKPRGTSTLLQPNSQQQQQQQQQQQNNSLSPPSTAFSSPNPNSAVNGARRMRPGSLIGSPGMQGAEVPLLSVLRVFAGENIESEATFKTVLLNRVTSTSELVKQSMQRFRLAGLEDIEEYFLSVRELGGEQRLMQADEKPLVLFQSLADESAVVPSVKRSSVGSMDSAASDLSINPAITRLGMNDFTDDSAVKFYLNRRQPNPHPLDVNNLSPDSSMLDHVASTTSFRFAIRLLVYSDDLPEHIVFDPSSQAVIPRSLAEERQRKNSTDSAAGPSLGPVPVREKIIFFPKHANVSEVVEAGLDRFGIVDGIVDGGDEVEDRISARRSISRVKYGLTMRSGGQDTSLSLLSKVIDSYRVQPLLRPYDRTSKEFRRRSVDATLILGSPEDILATDPIFIIRRAPTHRQVTSNSRAPGPVPTAVDELAAQQQQNSHSAALLSPASAYDQRPAPTRSLSATDSVYATPAEELSDPTAQLPLATPTAQEIIAAQRAGAQQQQRAILLAQNNGGQALEPAAQDRNLSLSGKPFDDDRERYSYVEPDGSETDASEAGETEFATAVVTRTGSLSRASRVPNSPRPAKLGSSEADIQDEETEVIKPLGSAPVVVDAEERVSGLPLPHSPSSVSTALPVQHMDELEDVMGERGVTSPRFGETLQERLDRVLSKAKERKGRSSSSTRSRSRQDSIRSITSNSDPLVTGTPPRGDSSNVTAQKASPTGTLPGRASPFLENLRRSPSPTLSRSTGPPPTLSAATIASSSPRTNGLAQSTASRTSRRPRASNASAGAASIVYHDDFGLETLLALVEGQTAPTLPRRAKQVGVDELFGRSLKDTAVNGEVRSLFSEREKVHDELDSRLDDLLRQVLSARE